MGPDQTSKLNLFSLPIFNFNKSNMLLPSQVLESLKNVAAPEPFALQNQYVPAVLAARAQDGEDDADDESDDGDRKAPPKNQRVSLTSQRPPKERQNPNQGLSGSMDQFGRGSFPQG